LIDLGIDLKSGAFTTFDCATPATVIQLNSSRKKKKWFFTFVFL